MLSYKVSPAAYHELTSLVQYDSRRSAGGASTVFNAVLEAFELLGANPLAGHFRLDLTHRPVRFWHVLSYMVVYVPEPTSVYILHIFHASQDVRTLLAEAHDLP